MSYIFKSGGLGIDIERLIPGKRTFAYTRHSPTPLIKWPDIRLHQNWELDIRLQGHWTFSYIKTKDWTFAYTSK